MKLRSIRHRSWLAADSLQLQEQCTTKSTFSDRRMIYLSNKGYQNNVRSSKLILWIFKLGKIARKIEVHFSRNVIGPIENMMIVARSHSSGFRQNLTLSQETEFAFCIKCVMRRVSTNQSNGA